MTRALRPLPLLALLALGACQPTPFAKPGHDETNSFIEPLLKQTEAGPQDAFENDVPRYRVQNIRTVPFYHDHKTYLLRETQQFIANAGRETGYDHARYHVAVYEQTQVASKARLLWKKTVEGERAQLIVEGGFPIYRVTTLGCCGTRNHVASYNAINGNLIASGAALLPESVALTDAKGATVTRYVSVDPSDTEHHAKPPTRQAAIVTLASESKIIARLRLLAAQEAKGEQAYLEHSDTRKLARLNPKHDKAAIVLRTLDGQNIRIPFGLNGFLTDKAKLPAGWRLQAMPAE